MSSYHVEIVNLSLDNNNVLKGFPVLNIKKRFLGYVKIYTISIPESHIEKTALMFQNNMGTKLNKEWYITFHNDKKVIVVFRNRIFELSATGIKPIYQKLLDTSYAEDKAKWDEMILYAKSLGIPDEQCDFLPEDFAEQKY